MFWYLFPRPLTAKSVIVHIEKADRIVVTGNNNNIRADKVTKVEVKL